MEIQLVCTRGCSHRLNLERELRELGVPYQLIFVEDQPDLAARLGIRHSPNIVIDGVLVYSGQPDEVELRRLLGLTA